MRLIILTADEEEKYIIAQANSPIAESGEFLSDKVEARYGENFVLVAPTNVDYMDVSPKQMVSIATALIPFPGAR
jgi:DNA-directed RNA polymerase subunit beta